jgi:hypothetical protein
MPPKILNKRDYKYVDLIFIADIIHHDAHENILPPKIWEGIKMYFC